MRQSSAQPSLRSLLAAPSHLLQGTAFREYVELLLCFHSAVPFDTISRLRSASPSAPLCLPRFARSRHLTPRFVMSIRRPPTAITLKPSDVTEMAEHIAKRNAAAAAAAQPSGLGSGGAGRAGPGKDAQVERERKQREEREARGRNERIGAA